MSMDSSASAFRMESQPRRCRRWKGGFVCFRPVPLSSQPFAIKRVYLRASVGMVLVALMLAAMQL